MNKMMGSIRFQLNALFIVIVTSLLMAFGAVYYFKAKATHEELLDQQVQAMMGRLTTSLPNALWNFDKNQIDQILISEMSSSFVVGIFVNNGSEILSGKGRDKNGRVVPISGIPLADFNVDAPIMYTNKTVGKATIYVSRANIAASLNSDLILLVLQILVLDVVIVLALSRSLTVVVLRPLSRVRDALHNIAGSEADLTKTLPRCDSTEFNDVVDSFNTFVVRLQQIILQVRSRTDIVATSLEQFAQGNQDLSKRTEAQAASLEETAIAMAQLTSTVAYNADSADQANKHAQSASAIAAKGGEIMDSVVRVMGDVSGQSRKVTDIINVISSIAFRTNILALNAAVEAARAGEHGKGFAVVAQEVKNLAQRSAHAAQEIKALITDSVDTVEAGRQQVDEAGRTMQEILTAIQRVTKLVSEISQASQQQKAGIKQINDVITQVDRGTQQNAALAEETSAATTSLHNEAVGLVKAVGAFKVAGETKKPPLVNTLAKRHHRAA